MANASACEVLGGGCSSSRSIRSVVVELVVVAVAIVLEVAAEGVPEMVVDVLVNSEEEALAGVEADADREATLLLGTWTWTWGGEGEECECW